MRGRLILAALLLSVGAAVAAPFTHNSPTDATSPGSPGCIYVAQSGTTDTKLCSPNFEAGIGAVTAPANTMRGNWAANNATDAANAMPSCPDVGGLGLFYLSGTGAGCATGAGTATMGSSPNQTGTTSTIQVMAGFSSGIGFQKTVVTPLTSGNLYVSAVGYGQNAVLNDGMTMQLRYGTGTPPVNGATATGTTVGVAKVLQSATPGMRSPYRVIAYVSGLTPGTAYWFDLGFASVTGGTTTLFSSNITAIER